MFFMLKKLVLIGYFLFSAASFIGRSTECMSHAQKSAIRIQVGQV